MTVCRGDNGDQCGDGHQHRGDNVDERGSDEIDES